MFLCSVQEFRASQQLVEFVTPPLEPGEEVTLVMVGEPISL